MAQDSKIEWCDHTANLFWGCVEVHAGCDNCYARAWSKRYEPTSLWGKETPRMEIKGVWDDLAKFQRKAAAANRIDTVFVGSMMDIGETDKLVINRQNQPVLIQPGGRQMTTMDIRWRFFNEVVPASPNLLFLFLSKRPSNYNKIIPPWWVKQPPVNVMFGTSVVDVKTYNTLVPQLRGVNGRRFLSIEPQLGPIRDVALDEIDWVIQGGESGPKARPFEPYWAQDMAELCDLVGVPYFFKQTGSWLAKDWGLNDSKGGDLNELPDFMRIRQFPEKANNLLSSCSDISQQTK